MWIGAGRLARLTVQGFVNELWPQVQPEPLCCIQDPTASWSHTLPLVGSYQIMLIDKRSVRAPANPLLLPLSNCKLRLCPPIERHVRPSQPPACLNPISIDYCFWRAACEDEAHLIVLSLGSLDFSSHCWPEHPSPTCGPTVREIPDRARTRSDEMGYRGRKMGTSSSISVERNPNPETKICVGRYQIHGHNLWHSWPRAIQDRCQCSSRISKDTSA